MLTLKILKIFLKRNRTFPESFAVQLFRNFGNHENSTKNFPENSGCVCM